MEEEFPLWLEQALVKMQTQPMSLVSGGSERVANFGKLRPYSIMSLF